MSPERICLLILDTRTANRSIFKKQNRLLIRLVRKKTIYINFKSYRRQTRGWFFIAILKV